MFHVGLFDGKQKIPYDCIRYNCLCSVLRLRCILSKCGAWKCRMPSLSCSGGNERPEDFPKRCWLKSRICIRLTSECWNGVCGILALTSPKNLPKRWGCRCPSSLPKLKPPNKSRIPGNSFRMDVARNAGPSAFFLCRRFMFVRFPWLVKECGKENRARQTASL